MINCLFHINKNLLNAQNKKRRLKCTPAAVTLPQYHQKIFTPRDFIYPKYHTCIIHYMRNELDFDNPEFTRKWYG